MVTKTYILYFVGNIFPTTKNDFLEQEHWGLDEQIMGTTYASRTSGCFLAGRSGTKYAPSIQFIYLPVHNIEW